MRFFISKDNCKKIVTVILLVILFNFTSPTILQADAGGALFKPIGQLLCALGDVIIQLLQDSFLKNEKIDYTVQDGITTYIIQYSPGAIFSNKIPGFDVNFINPQYTEQNPYEVIEPAHWKQVDAEVKADLEDAEDEEDTEDVIEAIQDDIMSHKKFTDHGFDEDVLPDIYTLDGEDFIGIYYGDAKSYIKFEWEFEGNEYMLVAVTSANAIAETGINVIGFFTGGSATQAVMDTAGDATGTSGYIRAITGVLSLGSTEVYFAAKDMRDEGYFDDTYYYLYQMSKPKETGETIESTSNILKDRIATYYKAIRAIALVGLLSVLVYIGIRILISSTNESKAKYKNMLIDWIIAICILFILQYIMVGVLAITEEITKIFSGNAIDISGRDVLMSDIRQEIFSEQNGDFFNIFSYVLMYVMLVIFTIIFTWKYLKRVIYMAFLTIIAPLIALTYPLDKIKDGKAQAFTMWIREYIFYALLQPAHLLIYSIIVGTGKELLVEDNPLFTIAAIAFLIPAEKFFKKMFGFDRTEAGSDLKAAAGGALFMRAINKLGQKTSNLSESKESGTSSSSSTSTPRYNMDKVADKNQKKSTDLNGYESRNTSSQYNSGNALKDVALGESINQPRYGKRNFKNGAKTLSKHYLNKGANKIGRIARRGALGTLGAATLGTLGLATGLATGDAEQALQYGIAGGTAGYIGANNLGDKVIQSGKQAVESGKQAKRTFDEASLGTDEYNTRNLISELENDSYFKKSCQGIAITSQKEREKVIRQFCSNGIANKQDIKRAIDIGIRTKAALPELIAAKKIRQEMDKYGMTREEIKQKLKNNGITDKKDIDRAINLIDKL